MNSQKATRLDFQVEKYRFLILWSLLLSLSLVLWIIISVAKINKTNLHLVLCLNIASSHLFLSFSARLKTSDRYFRDILTWFNYVTLEVFFTNYVECSKFCFKEQIHSNPITHVLSPFCSSSQVSEYPFEIQTDFFEPSRKIDI